MLKHLRRQRVGTVIVGREAVQTNVGGILGRAAIARVELAVVKCPLNS